MKKMALVGISIVAIGFTGWMLREKRPASALSGTETHGSAQSQAATVAPDAVPARALAGAVSPAQGTSVQAPAVGTTAAVAPIRAVDPQVVSILSGFSSLHQKVMLNEKEEAEKKAMLRDPRYLRMSASFLKDTQAMLDPSFTENQNAAIDILIEALKGGNKAAAHQAISEIVLDSQVENSKLSDQVRKTLAGIKGELLYHATALNPREFAQVTSQLPGPVSQKIWQNVQEKQQDNFNESQAEMQAHHAKWKRN